MITVRLKSNNDEVYILQKLLRKVGYTVLPDGDFGPKTDKAVRDFQFSHSLIADGVVGTRTWDLLFSKAFKPGEEILGTDIYQHDKTTTDSFWQELQSKHHFCFVKSTEGTSYNDPKFLDHMKRLKENKILRGGYHFFRMLNDDVEGQVQNFLDSGEDYREKGVLPPVLDVEPTNDEWKRIAFLSQNRLAIVKRMQRWLAIVEAKTGKRPIIYTSKHIWDNILKAPTGFSHYPLWVANYTDGPKPTMPSGWANYAIWQFTETGTIGGHQGFDVNRLNIPYKELLKMAGY